MRSWLFAIPASAALCAVLACLCSSGTDANAQVNGGGGGLFAPTLAVTDAGSVTPINPTAAPSYWIDYPADNATQSSGAVSAFNDEGPAAATLYAASGAQPSYTATFLNGHAGVIGNGSSSWMASDASPNFAGQTATVYFVGTISTAQNPGIFLEQTTNSSTNSAFGILNAPGQYSTAQITSEMGGTSSGYNYQSVWTGSRSSAQILTFTFDRSETEQNNNILGPQQETIRVGRNLESGYFSYSTTQAGNFATGPINLFARSGTTYPVAGTVARVLIYPVRHSQATQYGVIEYLAQEFGLLTTLPSRTILWSGDSISSSGTGTGDIQSFTDLLVFPGTSFSDGGTVPATYDGYQYNNYSFAGRTLQDMAAHVSDEMVAGYRLGVPNYAVIFGGTNDLAQSSSVTSTTLYGYVTTMVSALNTAGVSKIGITTMLPRCGSFAGGQSQSGFETVRQAFNTLIRNGALAGSFTLIDIGGDATIGAAGACTNTTYYQPDGVHPNWSTKVNIELPYFLTALAGWN